MNHPSAASMDVPKPPTPNQTNPEACELSSLATEPASPATYLPFSNGRYHVTPNLFSFDTDFGNGSVDQQLFQIDEEFAHYRQNKQHARTESLEKYVCIEELNTGISGTLNAFIIDTLVKQQANFFQRKQQKNHRVELQCRLTGETLVFDTEYNFLAEESCTAPAPRYITAFDALASQVQEDFAVIKTGAKTDRLIALHLCAPNHWAARDKIGDSFFAIHRSVAGMDAVNKKSHLLLNTLLNRGPFVRFAWGLASDRRLNHHPEPAENFDSNQWAGRKFGSNEALYVRVERQTLHGFPEAEIIFFTIRTYFYNARDLIQNPRNKTRLISAIKSMTPQQLKYKGLFDEHDIVLDWLKNH